MSYSTTQMKWCQQGQKNYQNRIGKEKACYTLFSPFISGVQISLLEFSFGGSDGSG